MEASSLKRIHFFGQSVWLDYLDRKLIDSGALRRLIEDDGICGVTTNPAIFEKSIDETDFYGGAIAALAEQGRSAAEIYGELTVRDVADAAALLRPIYDASDGADGFVSLEVSPHLANNTAATLQEARELWARLARPNVLIKVPGTRAGLPAIRRLLAEGVNVNVTLLFGLARYGEVAQAYLGGLEDRLQAGQPVRCVASVASFFLSRIDTLVDSLLQDWARARGPKAPGIANLRGETAIACAKLAYQQYRAIFSSERFRRLQERGARPQRLLWASTSTKDPAYADTKYVEALIGPDTVNTMPLETINAYRDHGRPALRLTDDMARMKSVLAQLPGAGVDMERIAQQLEDEGVQKFIAPYNKLLASIDKKAREVRAGHAPPPPSVAWRIGPGAASARARNPK